MSQTPWWGLPLVAGLFALGGVVAAQVVAVRTERANRAVLARQRTNADRRAAYVALLAAFQSALVWARRGFDGGGPRVDSLLYVDRVAPALMEVRLVASMPVLNAALAVHKLMEEVHEQLAAASDGRGRGDRFLELLGHVPLTMQEFEKAIREELGIDTAPPVTEPVGAGGWSGRLRAALTGVRAGRSD
jgi:hypothetical protein